MLIIIFDCCEIYLSLENNKENLEAKQRLLIDFSFYLVYLKACVIYYIFLLFIFLILNFFIYFVGVKISGDHSEFVYQQHKA